VGPLASLMPIQTTQLAKAKADALAAQGQTQAGPPSAAEATEVKRPVVTAIVTGASSVNGKADSGVKSENGVGNGGGGTSNTAGSMGMVDSPFLDMQSVTTAANDGSGKAESSIGVADPAVVADEVTNGDVGANVFFGSNTKAVAESSPASTGGSALTAGFLTATGGTNGMGLLTSGTSGGTVNGSGLGASSNSNGLAGGNGVGAITGAAFTTGESNQAAAPFTGTGDVTASFTNGGRGSFAQAAPAPRDTFGFPGI
jgi:hypothetical protein